MSYSDSSALAPRPWLVPWVVPLLAGILTVTSFVLGAQSPDFGGLDVAEVSLLLAFVTFPVVGALIASRFRSHPIGWIFMAVGVCVAASAVTDQGAQFLSSHRSPAPTAVAYLRWAQELLWIPAYLLLSTFLFLVFPTGTLPSRRWRPVAIASGVALLVALIASGLRPGPIGEDLPVENPVGIDWLAGPIEVVDAALLLVPILGLISAMSLVVRFRRSDTAGRAQIKWFVFAAAAFVMLVFLPAGVAALADRSEPSWAIAIGVVGFALVPAAAGLAILRNGLYQIDLVINRTLVWTVLTLILGLSYVAVVAIYQALSDTNRPGAGPLLATGVLVLAFQPLRSRVQRLIDRLAFGERDPYRVLRRLGASLEQATPPQETLQRVVDTVAVSMKLPYVAIRSRAAASPVVAASGTATANTITIPMAHHGRLIGELAIAPRSPRERLRPRELQLLEDIARQAAVTMHAAALSEDLQRSRERLVGALEDERRRLRHDLHDGLGPTLAGLALQLHGAHRVLTSDPPIAATTISRAIDLLEQCTLEVRRIVDGLRPQAVDQLGLIDAVRQQAAALSATPGSPNNMTIDIRGPTTLPDLPAAVEVAAYRIATEAMTNASRHAAGHRCTVRFALDDCLHVEISDDGCGLNPSTAAWGIGLASMQQRANDLGGTLRITSRPERGTSVSASLPLAQP